MNFLSCDIQLVTLVQVVLLITAWIHWPLLTIFFSKKYHAMTVTSFRLNHAYVIKGLCVMITSKQSIIAKDIIQGDDQQNAIITRQWPKARINERVFRHMQNHKKYELCLVKDWSAVTRVYLERYPRQWKCGMPSSLPDITLFASLTDVRLV
jgi:hypothetical protein